MTEIEQMIVAANANNGEAQYDLAIAYMNGDGVPQNYAEAYFWFSVCYDCKGVFWSPSPSELAAEVSIHILDEATLGKAMNKAILWLAQHGSPVAGDYSQYWVEWARGA